MPGFMDEDNEDYLMPLVIETASSFRPSLYQSLLLPAENKPLEAKVLKRAKEVLVDADTKTMAMHITKIDSMVGLVIMHFYEYTLYDHKQVQSCILIEQN